VGYITFQYELSIVDQAAAQTRLANAVPKQGYLMYYKNTGTSTSPQYQAVTSLLGSTAPLHFPVPRLVDLKQQRCVSLSSFVPAVHQPDAGSLTDGLLDIVLGADTGDLYCVLVSPSSTFDIAAMPLLTGVLWTLQNTGTSAEPSYGNFSSAISTQLAEGGCPLLRTVNTSHTQSSAPRFVS
jgi:hypothetical protein